MNNFATGVMASAGSAEQLGFNASYGIAKNLEIGTTVAFGLTQAPGSGDVAGFGDVQLGLKYQFISQDEWGFEAAVVPSVTVPTHTDALLGHDGVVPTLSLQVQKNWGTEWTAFGGGGCTLADDALSQNFCLYGAAVAWQIEPDLQIGAEVYHFTPGAKHGLQTTGLGFGVTYDFSSRWHLLASAGPGVQNAAATDDYTWYFALQFTR
ncbi:MAG TPA: transporter [Rhodopila sp.]|nr:transporter [Rhodopila sp.]